MPMIKSYKAEKVNTHDLAKKALDVCREMLDIMCDQARKDGDDDGTI